MQPCSICTLKMRKPLLSGHVKPCRHQFHGFCILKWMVKSIEQGKIPTCPLCRQQLTGYEVRDPTPQHVRDYEEIIQDEISTSLISNNNIRICLICHRYNKRILFINLCVTDTNKLPTNPRSPLRRRNQAFCSIL